jgi:hypothetical protein
VGIVSLTVKGPECAKKAPYSMPKPFEILILGNGNEMDQENGCPLILAMKVVRPRKSRY